jgi:hypothetical protein
MMTLRILTALALGAAGFTLAVAGCGGDDSTSASSTTQARTGTTTTTAPSTTTTTTAKPKPMVKTLTIVVQQGEPKGGIKTFKVKQGDRVAVVVRSDIQDSVHLHGYDIERPMTNGKSRIAFTATVPGRFDIELEDHGLLLARVQVEP